MGERHKAYEIEKPMCLQCGNRFMLTRDFSNRHAKIRYCAACKRGFKTLHDHRVKSKG